MAELFVEHSTTNKCQRRIIHKEKHKMHLQDSQQHKLDVTFHSGNEPSRYPFLPFRQISSK